MQNGIMNVKTILYVSYIIYKCGVRIILHSNSYTLKIAFVLDEDLLKKIDRLIQSLPEESNSSYRRESEYTVHLKGGRTINDITLDELLRVSEESEIDALDIRSSTKKISLTIKFSDFNSMPIYYLLSTDDEMLLPYYENQFRELLEQSKPLYSFIAISEYWPFLLFVLPLMIILYSLTMSFAGFLGLETSLLNVSSVSVYIFLCLIIFLFTRILINLLPKIFPIRCFKIGYGKKKYDELKWIRLAVLVPMYLTLFAVILEKIL